MQQLTDWRKWGTFQIPVLGLAVFVALLLFRNAASFEEFAFIQSVATWLLGAIVISYAHSLARSTWLNLDEKEKDLPPWVQVLAVGAHALWLGVAVIR